MTAGRWSCSLESRFPSKKMDWRMLDIWWFEYSILEHDDCVCLFRKSAMDRLCQLKLIARTKANMWSFCSWNIRRRCLCYSFRAISKFLFSSLKPFHASNRVGSAIWTWRLAVSGWEFSAGLVDRAHLCVIRRVAAKRHWEPGRRFSENVCTVHQFQSLRCADVEQWCVWRQWRWIRTRVGSWPCRCMLIVFEKYLNVII